jgi:hypothetical protein
MPAGRSGSARIVRAGLPNRRAVICVAICLVIFLGAGPRRVFIRKPEKTITQTGIGGIAGEMAATLGCSRRWKDCAIGLTRNKAGVPFGALNYRRLEAPFAGNPCILPVLCPMGDSIRLSGTPRRTGIGSRQRYIDPVVIWFGVAT